MGFDDSECETLFHPNKCKILGKPHHNSFNKKIYPTLENYKISEKSPFSKITLRIKMFKYEDRLKIFDLPKITILPSGEK